jgi:hypothetical protein
MAKAKAKQATAAGDNAHHGNYYYYCDPAAGQVEPEVNESDPATIENYELLKKESESDENENQ